MRITLANGGLLVALLVAVVGVLPACTAEEADPEETTTTAASVETTVTPTEPTTTTTTEVVRETLPLDDVPPLAIYLAAIDRGLSATRYAGDVYLDPESFIATGQLFCSLLDAGVSPTGVLESYLAVVETESETGEIEDDQLVLGGVVLGAAVQVICPEFADALALPGATTTTDSP